MFEFNIKEGLISVTQLQNGPNDALQEIVGTYMKLSKLKRVKGLNRFYSVFLN